jgi:hypothetical protein
MLERIYAFLPWEFLLFLEFYLCILQFFCPEGNIQSRDPERLMDIRSQNEWKGIRNAYERKRSHHQIYPFGYGES